MINEQQFAKGFNAGYVLQQHEPELANQISQSVSKQSAYVQGIEAGREQYLADLKARIKSISPNVPEPPDRDKDRDMDMER